MNIINEDRDVLALTLWGEARGEGLAGQVAVAWTIRNRVEMDLSNDGKPDWWGEGYTDVCRKAWQFSCWNSSDPNFPYLVGEKPIPAAQMRIARQAATAVIEGQLPDPTKGATHYFATALTQPPKWAGKSKQTLVLGRHVFFKEVP